MLMAWFPAVEPQPIFGPATVRATHALTQIRKHRHHRGCMCMQFDHLYCNATDALWSRALDRILDEIGDTSAGDRDPAG